MHQVDLALLYYAQLLLVKPNRQPSTVACPFAHALSAEQAMQLQKLRHLNDKALTLAKFDKALALINARMRWRFWHFSQDYSFPVQGSVILVYQFFVIENCF